MRNPIKRFVLGAACTLGALLFVASASGSSPLQELALPSGGTLVAPPRQFTPVLAACPGMARGGQQTVLLQNYKTWDGVDQTLNVRVGPCATLDADPPSSANGIVLEPGQAMEWRVSAFGPCVISEGAADAGARVGAVCGGGALR